MSMADEIEKLKALRDAGTLSEQEFADAKARLIGGDAPVAPASPPAGGTNWWTWRALGLVLVAAAVGVAVLSDQWLQTLKFLGGGIAVLAVAVAGLTQAVEDLNVVAISGIGTVLVIGGALFLGGAAPLIGGAVLLVAVVGMVVAFFQDML